MKNVLVLILAMLVFGVNCLAQATSNTDPDAAKFVTSDINLFWTAYDKAKPENDLIVYVREPDRIDGLLRDTYLDRLQVVLAEPRLSENRNFG